MEQCKSICETNRDRCEAFARRHGVYQEPQENQEQRELMEKAREELGCTSMASCKSICDASPERCREFSARHGFDRPREEHQEQRNVQMMQEDAAPQAGQSGYGPADCKTERECEQYCKTNPSRCPGFTESQRREGAREERREQENEQDDDRDDERENEREDEPEDERDDIRPPGNTFSTPPPEFNPTPFPQP